tara:strand:- start:2229 stop:2795 length:567 start_codon:yes stop_codon:yes gene_type:complete
MGLFKKKKEIELKEEIPELPELPELPEAPSLPSEEIPDVPAGLPKIETHPLSAQELPTLPASPIKRSDNQDRIKQEINKPKEELIPSIAHSPKLGSKRTLEMTNTIKRRPSKVTKDMEPVFIRLDKFQTTLDTFEEIKEKIQEIEDLLTKTRDIKQKEEQELIEWEREIQTIKTRIDIIDKTIFNKLD